jgi:hypothetical protein
MEGKSAPIPFGDRLVAHPTQLSRRAVLRGVGASVALPWLELMSPKRAWGAGGTPPVRVAYFYVPNGVHMPAWRPTDRPQGGDQLDQLPPTLAPLQSLSDYVTVISNLAADHCNGEGAAHEPAGGGFLVGARCKHSEQPEVGGKSIDQTLAQEIGLATPIDSLALGIDPGHRGDHGYSGTYMSHISWRSPTTPVPLELNPRQLYDRLFRGQRIVAPNWNQAPNTQAPGAVESVEASVLDLVREETKSLQRQLGFNDRRKLEEYLEGLHDIERRMALSERDSHSHHQDAFDQDPLQHADEVEIPPLIIPQGKGIPSVYAEHVNLMLDILTLAFQSDTTRVASFMFSYEKSGRAYREVGAPGAHHSTSHHLQKPENFDRLSKINLHHMSLFARMLERMSSIAEGESTLLDNVCILYGSGISDGNQHNHDDLPVLVAGGAGGALRGGRHLKLEQSTPICNLYLDMLAAAGVQREHFGDSTAPLGLIHPTA